MIPELKEDLLHVERGRERFDENGGSDGVERHPDVRLRENEDIVPEAGLEIVLHLGQIEVRATAARNELLGVVVEVKTEIEERSGHGCAVDVDAKFVKMPSTRTDKWRL